MSDYSATFPTQRPVFSQDYSNGSKIDPRATFTRASTANVWDGSKHLSSENLIPDSNASQAWQTVRVTRTTSGSFLDGSDSFLIAEKSDTGSHYTSPNTSVNATNFVSGTEYTAVVFAKAGTDNVIQLAFPAGFFTSNAYANFDLSNASTTPVTGSAATATITALGSDWVKLTLTAPATATGSAVGIVVAFIQNDINGARIPVYAGDTASNVYVWEANVSSTGQKFLVETDGQIHREYAPTLKSVATAGAARFEYDPSTNVSRGILIESSRTNLLTYSNNFSQWGATNVVAEAGAAVGPDGQLAYVMREDSTAGVQHRLSLSANNQSYGAAHTMSVYAKKVASSNQTRYLRLRVNGLSGLASVQFDLSNGTIVRTSGSQLDSQSISSVGNGWYRLTMTYTNTATERAVGMIITGSPDTTDTLPSYDGDGYTSFALFGAMVEEGSHASSLVTSNSGSQTTRSAESLSMPIASTGYTGGPVTLLAESTTETAANNPVTIQMYVDGDHQIIIYGKSPNKRAAWVEADGSYSTLTSPAAGNGVRALRVDTNDIATALNGTIDATDTSQTLPDLTGATVYIGDDQNGGNSINGHIKRVAIYNEALSDTNLQALTS